MNIRSIAVLSVALCVMSLPSYALFSETLSGVGGDWSQVDGAGGRLNGDNWVEYTLSDGSTVYDAEDGAQNDSTNGGASFSADGDIASGWDDTGSGVNGPTGPCTTAGDTQCGESASGYYYYHVVGTNDGDDTDLLDDIIYFRMRINDDPTTGDGFNSAHWNFLMDLDGDDFKEFWVDLQGGGVTGSTTVGRVNILYEDINDNDVTSAAGAGTTSGNANNATCVPDAAATGTTVNSFVACNSEGQTTGDCSLGGVDRSFARAVQIPGSVGAGPTSTEWFVDVVIPVRALTTTSGACYTKPGKLTDSEDFDEGVFAMNASSATWLRYSTSDSNTDPLQKDTADETFTSTTPQTLPVTIAYLNAVPRNKNLLLEWSTATETSNVGFNVYAVVNGEWIKINDEMLPGSLDSLEPQHYEEMLANPFGNSLTELGIAGVDVDGKEDRHGPYAVGKVRGKRPHAEKINWKQVRSEMKAGLNARKARKAATAEKGKNINKGNVIHVDVAKSGLYKITDQDLRAAGLSLPRIEADQIALSFRGTAVARHIGGLNNKGEWNGKSWIEFVAEAPAGRDAVYLNANRYQLSRDTSMVYPAPAFEKPEVAPARYEVNNRYAFTIPSEDPWYDAQFYAIGTGSPGSLSRSFDLPGLQKGEAELMIYSSALSQGTHHMIVELNGTVIDDVQTEGWTPWVVNISVSSSQLKETGNLLTLTLPGDRSDFDYVLYDKLEVSYPHSSQAEVLSADLQRAEKVNRNTLSRGRADLLVISHPALIGEALDSYIADRNAEGWDTKLVDVFDIYQAYGYGMATPSAITDYLDDAKEMGYSHVQLVGAASYDYRDYLGLGSVSFIPSIYERTAGIINYTPCDSCLVMDESQKPAAAIGRWPVHSLAELQAVINKGRAWANGQSSAHTSLLIADANEGKNNFVSQVEETTRQLVETDGWNEPARVYLDDAIAAAVGDVDAGVAAAKADLVAALEAGASITVFSGHGAPSTWSFKGLLKQQDIAGIQNAGKPTLALPLTCYTTYAESPYTSSLAHQLMAAGENAAVAVYGAATLSSFSHNSEMGKRVISGLLEDQTLGESILNGKLDLNSSYRDVILNSNLLGDVTLKLQ